MTYYVDQQEKPPFGVDKKGQVCLAGYRDRLLMKRPDSVAYLVPGYDSNALRSTANTAVDSTAIDQPSHPHPRESDDDDNACLIQLEFYPQIIDANVHSRVCIRSFREHY